MHAVDRSGLYRALALLLCTGAGLLSLAGCAGVVDLGAMLCALLMLGAAAGLQAQAKPAPSVEWQAQDHELLERLALQQACVPQSYPACVDGQVVTQKACCPVGVVCNYGQIGVKLCRDGSCVTGIEDCPDPACIPQTYRTCEDGKVVTHQACCPIGVACNYGQLGLKLCPDGTCVTRFEECAPEHECIPQSYRVCEDGVVVTKQACCPVGVACNYGQIGVKICADGYCVSGLEECPPGPGDECQPQSYRACENGVVVTKQACCPPGVVCNFGQVGVKLCPDGSCVSGNQRCLNLTLQSVAP